MRVIAGIIFLNFFFSIFWAQAVRVRLGHVPVKGNVCVGGWMDYVGVWDVGRMKPVRRGG